MAIVVSTDVAIIVNGVTLSDHVTKVTTTDTRAKKDITCFGATSIAYAKGLGDASLSITFLQDFAAGKVHATLQPLIAALLFDYTMLDAAIGEPSAMTVEITNASQTGVTYPVA